jgi:hypothetical protein
MRIVPHDHSAADVLDYRLGRRACHRRESLAPTHDAGIGLDPNEHGLHMLGIDRGPAVTGDDIVAEVVEVLILPVLGELVFALELDGEGFDLGDFHRAEFFLASDRRADVQ